MGAKYDELLRQLRDIHNINMAMNLMGWDRQVNMPRGGAEARAAQIGTLAKIAHERFTSDEMGKLLDEAAAEVEGMPYDSDEASMVRVVKEDYAEQTRLPTEFVEETARVVGVAHEYWADARQNNDFQHFLPILRQIIDLKRRECELIGYQGHPYDALLGQYERGITSAQVKAIFDEHKPHLVRLISDIQQVSDRVSDAPVHGHFPIDQQREFAVWVIKSYGYDLNRGRYDIAVHPFCNHNSKNDVRVTTRYYEDFLNPALFGMMHEAGHAMYEQGIGDNLEGTPLGGGTSLGVHESQSRMWENIVGRSKGFWSWAYPKLQETFPAQFTGVSLDDFYRAVNKVHPSFIRVEADEATYNLHIMLRFELEMAMIDGSVGIEKLPQEWNERFESYLGIVPPTDTLGVLQDVHWSMGLVGYFATYALGTMLSAQYYRKAVEERPSIPDDIASGRFDTLLTWMNENIHIHGRKFTGDELTRRLTGEGIQSKYYTEYLQKKYGELYGL